MEWSTEEEGRRNVIQKMITLSIFLKETRKRKMKMTIRRMEIAHQRNLRLTVKRILKKEPWEKEKKGRKRRKKRKSESEESWTWQMMRLRNAKNNFIRLSNQRTGARYCLALSSASFSRPTSFSYIYTMKVLLRSWTNLLPWFLSFSIGIATQYLAIPL